MDFEEIRKRYDNGKETVFESRFNSKAIEGKITAEIEKREPSIQWKKETEQWEKCQLEIEKWKNRWPGVEDFRDRRIKLPEAREMDDFTTARYGFERKKFLEPSSQKDVESTEYKSDWIKLFEKEIKIGSQAIGEDPNKSLRPVCEIGEVIIEVIDSEQSTISRSIFGSSSSKRLSRTIRVTAKDLKLYPGTPQLEELTPTRDKKRGTGFRFPLFQRNDKHQNLEEEDPDDALTWKRFRQDAMKANYPYLEHKKYERDW